MEFKFRYRVKPVSLWILTMVNIYRSMMAVINIIFTVSMAGLIYRFWLDAGVAYRILMLAMETVKMILITAIMDL